jgi:2,3-bisphosphoglycerate-dependent phosphoglycerate mutase
VRRENQKWPDRLWIVRHGESAGNLARSAAVSAQQPIIDIALRDPDVALSELGHHQAEALADWFARLPANERPNVVLTSTYVRARQTAETVCARGGVDPDDELTFVIDERLREKEFGVLDRLTRWGIEASYPEQAEFRRRLGKFYHRPPGGESWCDVILRLRSVLDTVSLHYSRPGSRVLVVGHQVIVLCLRYLIEELTEEEILAIDRSGEVANCGVTSYTLDRSASPGGRLVLDAYNFVAPLEEAGAPVTSRPDAPAGAK